MNTERLKNKFGTVSRQSKQIITKRNKLFHHIVMCLRDPVIMLQVAVELRAVEDKYMGFSRNMYMADVVFLTWSNTKDHFTNKEARSAFKEVEPHLAAVQTNHRTLSALLNRLRKKKFIDRLNYKGHKTWFITSQGRLYLIDLTSDIRKLALEVIKSCETPKPMRRKRPTY